MRGKRKEIQHNDVQTTKTPDDLIIADVYEEMHEAKDMKIGVDVYEETYSAKDLETGAASGENRLVDRR